MGSVRYCDDSESKCLHDMSDPLTCVARPPHLGAGCRAPDRLARVREAQAQAGANGSTRDRSTSRPTTGHAATPAHAGTTTTNTASQHLSTIQPNRGILCLPCYGRVGKSAIRRRAAFEEPNTYDRASWYPSQPGILSEDAVESRGNVCLHGCNAFMEPGIGFYGGVWKTVYWSNVRDRRAAHSRESHQIDTLQVNAGRIVGLQNEYFSIM